MVRILSAAILALCLSTPAQAFIAQNGLVVEPAGGTDFTVPYSINSSPRAFWCAAGDYAIRVLGLPKDTRIYRTSAPPRRSGQGMDFSLDRSRATHPGLARISRSPGLTVANARFQCNLPSADRSR